jgi:hypothetical protein
VTLLLTWVAPDGIVMGADSALAWQDPTGRVNMTLSDAYKIIPYDRGGLVFGISFCGLAMINSTTWTSEWLRDHVAKCQPPPGLLPFATQLAARLNGLALAPGKLLAFQVARWERVAQGPGGIEPRFFEVSNIDRATAELSQTFSVADILEPQFIADVRTHRQGDKAWYPMRFGSAGIPSEFSTEWITKVLIPSHTRLAGVQVPQPHIASVAEYVRFLIGSVSDVLRLARQPATVNRPVETLLLFPDAREAVSTRY